MPLRGATGVPGLLSWRRLYSNGFAVLLGGAAPVAGVRPGRAAVGFSGVTVMAWYGGRAVDHVGDPLGGAWVV